MTKKVGLKNDGDKVRLDLVPVELVWGLGQVLTFGANKYGAGNYRHGIAYSRVFGALLRHIYAWQSGEELDPESGLPHLHHAACCITFLITYEAHKSKYSKFDDRPCK
jgi:hypothetical protein